MKKFEFSLKKLMEYKQQILKKEKSHLGELRKQKQLLDDEISFITNKKRDNCESFNRRMCGGLSPQHICLHKNYIESLNQQINNLHSKKNALEASIQNQLEIVIQITKDVDSLEKLEEKQLEEYNNQLTKQQELFIEEFVSHKSFVTVN